VLNKNDIREMEPVLQYKKMKNPEKMVMGKIEA